ncbi:iron uptake porin [Synechococcus elongatus]|uniref:Probable porin major outer membrane protein n=1 Tax=Synechococcus elongatus (strain ATCC 33912 / PCC 7942 / FACHB-805) TaxID=1140 RepID=Q9KHA8_SYNE7|nr:iron uptake porin [Synechococcus elongatus]AAF76153.1 SomA-like protein Rev11 [Synechococcus elongatus PCC 7942 = FACHB-805]ABB57637.1 probable porin; major outer membrane protein [Synechococcus elongatus PCC 7942 = FACHB-805]AJD57978.1 porin [Synechococcus elongatus UTEX 2973]MBD2588445.1 carbohydrate porin [Synechococcus elongatus FACHB-242]MBD2689392.1 carbohydrate porin [Synechococcus elongatus FACHB-1061]
MNFFVKAGLVVTGANLLAIAPGQALSLDQLQKIDAVTPDGITSGQITSVNELSDVKPTDWAYQALQSLVERYGCIVGYPDRTFRGARPLSRYEFAAGLNACLDKVIEFAASKEDLDTLKRLTEEFQAELATLRGRVDALEARTKELEATRFSSTTKLRGEVIFGLDALANSNGNEVNSNGAVSFGNKVDLDLDTSFTGKDLLKTRLRARNIEPITNRLAPGFRAPGSVLDYGGNSNNTFFIDKLYYTFPAGSVRFTVGTVGVGVQEYGMRDATFSSGANEGKTFRKGPANIYESNGKAGVGFDWRINPNFSFQLGYLNRGADQVGVDQGGFFGQGTVGTAKSGWDVATQLRFETDNRKFRAALAYSLRNDRYVTDLGTTRAERPFGAANYNTNNLALTMGWAVSDNFTISGAYGIGFANVAGGSDSATIQTWNVGLTFPDLFAKGNSGVITVGQMPYVTSASQQSAEDTGSLGLEVNYKFQVTDNISITPGIYLFNNTNGLENGGTSYVPYLRTIFRF